MRVPGLGKLGARFVMAAAPDAMRPAPSRGPGKGAHKVTGESVTSLRISRAGIGAAPTADVKKAVPRLAGQSAGIGGSHVPT